MLRNDGKHCLWTQTKKLPELCIIQLPISEVTRCRQVAWLLATQLTKEVNHQPMKLCKHAILLSKSWCLSSIVTDNTHGDRTFSPSKTGQFLLKINWLWLSGLGWELCQALWVSWQDTRFLWMGCCPRITMNSTLNIHCHWLPSPSDTKKALPKRLLSACTLPQCSGFCPSQHHQHMERAQEGDMLQELVMAAGWDQ